MYESFYAAPILETILSGQGVIIVLMALTAIALVSFFMPGGVRKTLSLIVIVLTAGIGIRLLNARKKKLISKFDRDIDEFRNIIINKVKMKDELENLEQEKGRLIAMERTDIETLKAHQSKINETKEKSMALEIKSAKLSAKLESRAENLDQGFEMVTPSPFRRELEDIKNVEKKFENTSSASSPIVNVKIPQIIDPNSSEKKDASIRVSVSGFHLKGDVA